MIATSLTMVHQETEDPPGLFLFLGAAWGSADAPPAGALIIKLASLANRRADYDLKPVVKIVFRADFSFWIIVEEYLVIFC